MGQLVYHSQKLFNQSQLFQIPFYLLALTIGINNLLDMLWAELVLRLDLFKLLAGINKQNVVILLTAFLEHQDTGRDACAIEDVGRKSIIVSFIILDVFRFVPFIFGYCHFAYKDN